MKCLNLDELRGLGGAERAFLEDAAKKIETEIENTENSALKFGLDRELMQSGLLSTLIVATASFAALHNKSSDKEALTFSVMRCMAEALSDVLRASS